MPDREPRGIECGMPERVITLAISDADWKALRTIQPEPVDWLKRTIRETIERAATADRPAIKTAGKGAV